MNELPDQPLVSVVLCSYSPEFIEHTKEAAESVLNQSYEDLELVIVVDGSEELYGQLASTFGTREEVRIHLNVENLGLLESRNIGAELAFGDIIAFIDDDSIADRCWIEELINSYQETRAAAAGGMMTAKWVAGKPEFLPQEFYWLVGVTHRGFATDSGEVRNTFGSNLSFKRDVFLELGGFDPKIGGRKGDENLQGGETELCARLQSERGEKLVYNPDAKVAHKVFEFRTELPWLINRAFWQGYSKRAMEVLVNEPAGDERVFLRRLLLEFVPTRLKRLAQGPSRNAVLQLVTLLFLTTMVGFGYLFGMVRYPGFRTRSSISTK